MAEDGIMAAAAAVGTTASSPRLTLARFLATLRGTEEEIYGRLIQLRAKAMVMEAHAWRQLLEDIKAEAAHPLHPKWTGGR
jgi:hypothetical protein